ncbi:MAG: flagellar biosynthetic protein FliO [Alphaproteobacteria bacterium]
MIMYLNAFLALVFVLGLIMLLGFVLKKFNLPLDSVKNLKSAKKHLKIIETMRIDNKRKILLLKCQDKNFLILAGEKDLLLSDNINIPEELFEPNQSQNEKAPI